MRAIRSVVGPRLDEQRTVSRYKLENDLRAWYLHNCQEHVGPDQHRYFKERRQARRWFRELCDNTHFQNVLVVLRKEQKTLDRTISLVTWLKDAQRIVNKQLLPYKGAGRLSAQDTIDAEGGLKGLLSLELDNRLPDGINKRSTAIVGLLDFLGLPSTVQEVAADLRRHARASVMPAKPKGAMEITRLLDSWEAPNRKD